MALTQISTQGIKNGTITGSDLATNVDLVDNQKLRFGAGDDLQIFHDGSNSILFEQGTGNLAIQSTGAEIQLSKGGSFEHMVRAIVDGAVELYHDNSKKFETTTDGAKLSGTQTIQAGAFSSNVTTGNKSFTASIDIQSTSMRGGVVVRNMNDFRSESVFNASFMHYDPFDTTANSFAFRAARGSTLADTFSVRSDGRTFVGERLSIGEASPSHKLHISADENTTIAYFDTDLGGRGLKINTFVSGNAASAGVEFEAPAGANKSAFVFKGASEFMRIHPSGKIGIGGVTNPEVMLDIRANDPGIQLLDTSQTSAYGNMDFAGDTLVLTSRGGTSSHGFTDFRTYNGSTIRTNMRIDSSGDVSIGSTSNPGTNRLNVVENSTDAFVNPTDSILRLTNENTSSDTNQVSISLSTSTTGAFSDSAIVSKASGSGSSNLLFFTDTNNGMSEKMRIETSGNIGIGTTSANVSGFNSDARVLTISGPKRALIELRGNIQAADAIGVIRFLSGNNNEAEIVSIGDSNFAGDLRFRTHGAEHMVINKDGNVIFGQDTTIDGGRLGVKFNGVTSNGLALKTTRTSTGSDFVRFVNSAGNLAGFIRHNGTTTVDYSETSDYRLKENAVAISDGITRLKTLKPYRFNFKSDPDKTVDGFFAHEVTAVPEAISGSKDEVDENNKPVYQGIDKAKLVPLLVAAVQELICKVEALQGS
tara:strand:+ start:518 stop:2629 length:2112 start_codon:yes stop_codon:yes gene_type:complete